MSPFFEFYRSLEDGRIPEKSQERGATCWGEGARRPSRAGRVGEILTRTTNLPNSREGFYNGQMPARNRGSWPRNRRLASLEGKSEEGKASIVRGKKSSSWKSG